MKVVEIFKSIEGEGIRAGRPCTFIRLYGCNMSCSYCDSMYACKGNDYTEMTVAEIMDKVKKLGCKLITLTGGEPLLHFDEVGELLDELSDYFVNIETNGSIDPAIVYNYDNTIVTMDYKCPSSGMEKFMKEEYLDSLCDCDVLKFVVGSKEDLERAREVISNLSTNPEIYFSPVFGEIEPREIVEFILENKLDNVHFQLQIHKFVWDKDARGV